MTQACIPIITIDGPSASGKGTVATRVAHALGWHVLDSGALYRAAALVVMEQGIDVQNRQAVAAAARTMSLRFQPENLTLDGRDVSAAIRQEAIGNLASHIAQQAPLRAVLLDVQRAFHRAPGLVADGRDMGTVIFPDAPLKIFLQASVAARASRRYKQLKQQGLAAKMESLVEDMQLRDQRDQQRLIKAPDAKVVDSSDLTVEETVHVVLGHWSTQGGCYVRGLTTCCG